ncbi:MAG: O-antigen ligase family protein [Clostridia bacterium]|nr:O-antigen ligase family protein [Clostridia bacterium]
MGILGVILGIAAAVCALLGTFLFGTTGAIIAAVLAAAAIVLAFLKRKKDGKGGIAAIAIAVVAVILAFSMSSTWSNAFKELHKKAVEYKPDGLWAQVSEDTSNGLMGIIKNLPTDEATMNALVDEMNELNKLTEK